MYDGKYPDSTLGDVVIVLKFKREEKFLKIFFLTRTDLLRDQTDEESNIKTIPQKTPMHWLRKELMKSQCIPFKSFVRLF